MCCKTLKILVGDAPATMIAKDSRKFPARNFVPGIRG
jgi:hypothetical protein